MKAVMNIGLQLDDLQRVHTWLGLATPNTRPLVGSVPSLGVILPP